MNFALVFQPAGRRAHLIDFLKEIFTSLNKLIHELTVKYSTFPLDLYVNAPKSLIFSVQT